MTFHVDLKDVGKSFPSSLKNQEVVLQDLNLKIRQGDFVSILGASGCGKSTLLRLIAGLEKATSGSIQVHRVRDTFDQSFVFQEANLLPWRTALENVMLPMELGQFKTMETQSKCLELLKALGLSEHDHKFPDQLSGGMKMRCSLARALITDPELLLMDEPFSALDEITRFRLAFDLRILWLKRKLTVIFVTHSLTEALYLSNRILLMSKNPGRLVREFEVQLPEDRSLEIRTSTSFVSQLHELNKNFSQAMTHE